jgi:hypothetical protein
MSVFVIGGGYCMAFEEALEAVGKSLLPYSGKVDGD